MQEPRRLLEALEATHARGVSLQDADSVAQDGIPQGSISKHHWKSDHVYPGVERDYWLYIPKQYGKITTLRNLSNLDTTLGKGPLLIGTNKRIFALGLPANRSIWPQIDQPLQTGALIDKGPRGQALSKSVNGDLFYRSTDGLRSFVIARRNFGQWGNLSMSSEMDRVLLRDAKSLLKHGSAIEADNRLLMTVNPVTTSAGQCYHRGICVLDFHLLSAMGSKITPAYDGLWTGLLTAISPCPLATNITAIAFLSRKLGNSRHTLLAGFVYTLGRMTAYVTIASGVVLFGMNLQIPALSLQAYGELLLGPFLVLCGIYLLGLFPIDGLPGADRVAGFTSGISARLADQGYWGAFLLGIVFALSFCPFSAVLFFAMLIPLALGAGDPFVIPAVFALATGLPVIIISSLLVQGLGGPPRSSARSGPWNHGYGGGSLPSSLRSVYTTS